jgi:hypothetical protein
VTCVAVKYRCQTGWKIIHTLPDLVGVAGFEPTAPRSQSECATKLRHTPSQGSVCARRERLSPRSTGAATAQTCTPPRRRPVAVCEVMVAAGVR